MKRAFSLVELSIVLVILGLLVGGVLSGQSLIRAAQLRSITTEYQRYYAATRTFRDKYFALPGDMNNAVAFWGAADGSTGNTAGCATTTTNTIATCNGNGDGVILNSTSSAEPYRFWQQLANAGLIEGSYTGIAGTAPLNIAPGSNSPGSKVASAAVWWPYSFSAQSGSTNLFDSSNYGNVLWLWGWSGGTWASILKPEEAWNIDTKMDDGKPGTGSIVSNWSNVYSVTGVACTDAASSATLTASYRLSDSGQSCGLWFRNVW